MMEGCSGATDGDMWGSQLAVIQRVRGDGEKTFCHVGKS